MCVITEAKKLGVFADIMDKAQPFELDRIRAQGCYVHWTDINKRFSSAFNCCIECLLFCIDRTYFHVVLVQNQLRHEVYVKDQSSAPSQSCLCSWTYSRETVAIIIMLLLVRLLMSEHIKIYLRFVGFGSQGCRQDWRIAAYQFFSETTLRTFLR